MWKQQLLLCAVLAVAIPDNAVCARRITPPILNVTARSDGSTSVTWRINSSYARSTSSIIIQRMMKQGGAFSSIGQYRGPRARRTISDSPGVSGTFAYRARLVTTKGKSSWSSSRSVEIKIPTSGAPADTPLTAGQSLCPGGTIEKVIELVNRERALVGAPALEAHPQLQWSARTHDIYIAASGVLSHDGWIDYIDQSGFKYGAIAENIAMGQTSAEEVMNTWMNSTGHRENLLSTAYVYIGVGCIADSAGNYWWVQNFGRTYQCPASP